tara:strand:+ start:1187 stop:1369 length:183 start_codon:yes stop_codon:yes gene_type:complete
MNRKEELISIVADKILNGNEGFPAPQTAGTLTQRKTYAMDKAREYVGDYMSDVQTQKLKH